MNSHHIVEQLRNISEGRLTVRQQERRRQHLEEQEDKRKEDIGKASQMLKGVLGMLGDGDKEEAKKQLEQIRDQIDGIIEEM